MITGLGNGGAEGVLTRLCLADRANSHEVISMMDAGVYGARLTAGGVPVHTLGMPRGRLSWAGVRQLNHLLRRRPADVIQTWMYHADLVGGLVARMAGHRGVVWGIRNASPTATTTSRATRLVARICASLSRAIPRRIISCSANAARAHQALGYDAARMVVVPNGYDVGSLAPDAAARERVRREWGVTSETLLLGMVARWDPAKDHRNLLASLARLPANLEWCGVLVGVGMTHEHAPLAELLRATGLQGRVVLAGARNDIPAVMNALDVHVLSSVGEGFPNVVAEAMACGTPGVVTDVGDAGLIVGPTGWIVPAADPDALSQAIVSAADAQRDRSSWSVRQRAARARIVQEFSVAGMVDGFNAVWQQAMNGNVQPDGVR